MQKYTFICFIEKKMRIYHLYGLERKSWKLILVYTYRQITHYIFEKVLLLILENVRVFAFSYGEFGRLHRIFR